MIFLILPSYNEEKNLTKIFSKINKISKRSSITVVLIDDCSFDKTYLLKNSKKKFKLIYFRHKKNKGLSIALESGFKIINRIAKKKDIIITMDSDNTHPVQIIPKMVDKIKKNNFDIVIASRFLKLSKVNGLSFFREKLSILAKYIFKFFYPFNNLNEYTCNYRAYKFKLINNLLKRKTFFKNEDFNIAAKILLFFIKNFKDLKIYEIPITLNYQYKIGSSKMKIFKNILLTLRLIFFKKI